MQAEDKARALADIGRPSFADHVASVAFGGKSPQDQRIVMLRSGGSCAMNLSHTSKRSDDYRNSIARGSTSAIDAQANGLADFCDGTSGNLQSLLSVGTFDDASA